MKINYLFVSLIIGAAVMTSCGEAEAEQSESKTEVKAEDTEENDVEEVVEDDFAVQNQWNDILEQVKIGDKVNLNMYLYKSSPAFSQTVWDAIDLSQEEYYNTFNKYSSYSQLPESDDTEKGTKVITVNFETVQDGETFESTAILYFVLKDGFIWVNGCELIG